MNDSLAMRKTKADLTCCPGSLELSDGGIMMQPIVKGYLSQTCDCVNVGIM
jgi:hypothetical protein